MIDTEVKIAELEAALQQLQDENDQLKQSITLSSVEHKAVEYVDNMFVNDTIEHIAAFLDTMRLTVPVRQKFVEVYQKCAHQDVTLTWSNAWLLQRRTNMFKLEMLEFKNTLVGDDADSLLFGDFDLTFEILATRLEARGGRTFEGFERTRGVRTAKCIEEYNRSCLSRLGRFNLFKRI